MGFISLVGRARARLVDVVSQKMEQGGAQAVSHARELVPVKTGQLQASISYHWSRREMRLTLVADRPYAAMVELGTGRMPARPYLRPAILEVGRMFGLASADVQFPNTPAKYQAGYASQVAHHRRGRIVIGHRRRK